ncbi:MAG: radical SAM protein [Pseudonocardiaceae bacterium]
MVLELRPLGVTCNLACDYCYQTPQRDAGNLTRPYDLDAMLAAVEQRNQPFSLFGGEPLLLRLEDLERIWRVGFERFGHNAVQTNGTLITTEHLELFRRYNVTVGVSVDGPAALNNARWTHNLERTRLATEATHQAIRRLCREHRPPGLIVTLHRGNATSDHLPSMATWMRELDALGIRSVRLHPLEIDSPSVRERYALSAQDNTDAILFFARLQDELNLRFDIIDEMRALLLGRDKTTSCVWRACDPYTTPAVTGIEGDGGSSNCGRTNKDGVDFLKADTIGFERYLMLYQTPQKHGGCQGCRFFLMCKGQCPGTAIDGDWRNRTEHCAIWTSIFTHIETALVEEDLEPLSVSAHRTAVETQLVQAWEQQLNPAIEDLLAHELHK